MSKKLFFKFKYLKLELEETNTLGDRYNYEFNNDFREEIEYLNQINAKNIEENQTIQTGVTIDGSKKDSSNIPQDFKEIYKIIVKEFHPDLKPENEKRRYENLLKKITNAYESQNWLDMISIAHEEGVNLPENVSLYVEAFENNLNDIEEEISHIKNKLSWVWATNLKPNKKNKKEIYSLLNIDAEKFEEWKNNRN